jgi:hypothetical protein
MSVSTTVAATRSSAPSPSQTRPPLEPPEETLAEEKHADAVLTEIADG